MLSVNDYIKQIVAEKIKKNWRTILSFDPTNITVEAEFDYATESFVIYVIQEMLRTKDSKRDETRKKTETFKDEYIVGQIPTSLVDHLKLLWVNFLWKVFHKRSKVKVRYSSLTHVFETTNHITEYVTNSEYICPHIQIGSEMKDHFIFLSNSVKGIK